MEGDASSPVAEQPAPRVSKPTAVLPEEPVQLNDNDMEWTFELPPVLKKKFRSMADQIRELVDAIKLVEAQVEKKLGKAEASVLLERKVDRDELEALLAVQMKEFERWKEEVRR
eukprot:EC719304.1.p1 GENE.EC719304.1~~EC719304.1.p1  ORF type:complete len:114 (+),score=21.59 EC719304.1:89-430(+)